MGRRTFTCLIFAAACHAQQLSDFAGTWVVKAQNLPVVELTLTPKGDSLTGALRMPTKFSTDPDGDVTMVGGEHDTDVVRTAVLRDGGLELAIGDTSFTMTLLGRNRATLVILGLPPLKFERVPAGTKVVLATSLAQRVWPPEIEKLRAEIKTMVDEDQAGRMKFDDARMKAADDRNRAAVLRIFEQYGWPKSSVIGKDAAHDYWLLIQHQTPEIMRRLLPAMEQAAKSGEASMSDYAYLYDRVQVGLGKPQRWGSQTKCVNGKPVLDPVDDPAGLAQRRKELFMMPVEDYLKMDYLVKFCANK
jgi:Family of unknown function (DUF6624)